ncbi:NADH-cytochrome b5 reductase-like isoform X5 [Ranitomeya variabilis]|uniref:NADH-cytochrome b5 reductase-like isoform X5 n=1 Tax=Ranitomeya variabilis TaxID=490064 RepID=UPI00405733B8
MVMTNNDKNDWSSLKPVEPTAAQCCGSGCSPCIYDLYQAELELWEKAKEKDNPDLLRKIRVQVYEHGLMSKYIKCWKPGDSIAWRGPFGGFLYKPNKFGELFMLCSGTGVAPMLPILTHVTDNEDDETFITLVVCARNFQNVYMKNFLREQSRFWNVRIFYVLSQEQSLDNLPMSYRENSKLGRIDSEFLAQVLETCRRKPYTLVCGSVSFTEDMTAMIKLLQNDITSIFSF